MRHIMPSILGRGQTCARGRRVFNVKRRRVTGVRGEGVFSVRRVTRVCGEGEFSVKSRRVTSVRGERMTRVGQMNIDKRMASR